MFTPTPESMRREMEEEYPDGIPEVYESILTEWAMMRSSPSATTAEREAVVAKLKEHFEPWLWAHPKLRWNAQL